MTVRRVVLGVALVLLAVRVWLAWRAFAKILYRD